MDDYGFDLLQMALGVGTTSSPLVGGAKDIPALAKYIASDACKNVYVMMGAGVSTSAGIPDFRSPETGLYANLARLNLPYPEAVFEINFFKRNPHPFYALAKELYPGKFRPTVAHSFLKLLSDKSLLRICFTQNIDTLERRAGVPSGKIIEAHGSFATQRCVDCKRPYDSKKIKVAVHEGRIPRCEKRNGLVKPDIVFFGESLPESFTHSIPELLKADLLIVMGTSLTVHPFASLANMVLPRCPRVLINLDQVGDFGHQLDDIVLLGRCDDIVLDLAKELGWEEELLREWEATAASVQKDETSDEDAKGEPQEAEKGGEKLKDEVEELAALIEAALGLSSKTDVDAGSTESDASEQAPEQQSPETHAVLSSSAGEQILDPAKERDDVLKLIP